MKSAYVTPILKKADLDRPMRNRIGRSPIYRCFRSHWNDSCLNSLWRTSEKTTYCQIVNQLTEHIIRQKPLCSEFCQTFCLHLILATLQFWRYSTCQLHLTASTIARYFNGCKLLTVLTVLSWPALRRIWVIAPNMCVFLLPGRLSLQFCMAFHKDRSSDRSCSCYILLTCCSLSDDIIFIRTSMLMTPRSTDLVIRLRLGCSSNNCLPVMKWRTG